MNNATQVKEGLYRASNDTWRAERRRGGDRRLGFPAGVWPHERRCSFRRQADRELYEKDHRRMIEEALADFAEKHRGSH